MMDADRKGIIAALPNFGFVRSKTTYIFGKIRLWLLLLGSGTTMHFLWGPFLGPVAGQMWCLPDGPRPSLLLVYLCFCASM
jgi:hypothetical protein